MTYFNRRLDKVLSEDLEGALLRALKARVQTPRSKWKYSLDFSVANNDEITSPDISTHGLPMNTCAACSTPEFSIPEESEASLKISAGPTVGDPHGLSDDWGWIIAYVLVRIEQKGVRAIVQTKHTAGDEILIGEKGELVPTTLDEVASAISKRFQEWASGLDTALDDPHWVRDMIAHHDVTDEFQQLMGGEREV